jgi:hypothetical protein
MRAILWYFCRISEWFETQHRISQIHSLQTQWFRRALKSFDKEDQAKFLQFVIGTSKLPLQGFAKLEGMNGPQKFFKFIVMIATHSVCHMHTLV